MKKVLIATLTVMSVIGAHAQKVTFDYDKEADFGQYKTIQFFGWQKDSGDLLNDLDKERLYNAFIAEFEAKGFKLVEEDGDLGLTFFVVVEEKTSTTAYTDYHGGMGYGGYYRGAWGWNNGSSTTTYTENDYLQGTFVVDFYDLSEEKLVWQGVSTGTVTENPKKREKTTPKRVKKLLKNFPPQVK